MANEELIYRITRAVYGRLGAGSDEQAVEQLVTEVYREIEPFLGNNGKSALLEEARLAPGESRGAGSSRRMIISVFGLDHPGIVAGVAQILAEAERTTRLIDSLLLLARADAGQGGLQLELTDISTSIREAIDQGRSFAAEKRIELTADFNPASVVVRGDGEALRRLFLILIDNAIKYTPEGGRVHLHMEGRNGHATIKVVDTGIGIAESDQSHIFDRFWRADKVRSRGMGGAGLGLSIARWIVDQHGGSIEVHSHIGEGSAFTVRIPLHNTVEPL